jgi:hypothetical protein
VTAETSAKATPRQEYGLDAKPLTSYRPYWAKRFGTAPFLPTSRAEMDALGWDSCDVVIVTGDAYVDHPSFGMAVVGRVLEAQGFRVGIIAQPDWHSAAPFAALGAPNLCFGVAAGNMDSMINRYTADRRPRGDDAYTPGGAPDKRPDRASLVYTQRCREAFGSVPILLGGIEASLRRIAHYDYWQDKVRRAILVDAQADLLLYGNAERAWWRSCTAWPPASRWNGSPMCGAQHSFGGMATRPRPAGSRWIRPRWTCPAASTTTSTPTRPPARRRPARAPLV